ncbi:MAG: hypothetical protein FWC11_02195 [Firmicutes bacterium]|nr:hypothetical protein [Bacillota bacterium]
MNYFEGFYVKCNSETESIAVIFGRNTHKDESSSFVQIITPEKTYSTFFKDAEYRFAYGNNFEARVDKNYVDEMGMFLDVKDDDFVACGSVSFGDFSPIKYDAMGFLKFFPKMECKHTVVSMKHSLEGQITINGRVYNFNGGVGYIEGDRGKSFPKKYFWSQCNINDRLCLFVSAAIIPYLGIRFMGTTCVVHFEEKEYRFATYLGAKVKIIDEKRLLIKQGNKTLEVEVIDDITPLPLFAPQSGKMGRTIFESLMREVNYKMTKGNEILFDIITKTAAHEYSSTE